MQEGSMLIRFLILLAVMMVAPAFASQELYVPPRSLEISMNYDGMKGDSHVFSVEIKSLLGSLQNISLSYEASEGVLCDSSPADLESLGEGETRKYAFSCKLTKKLLEDPNTWVRFRVEYLPDYAAIKSLIASDQKTYPDENLRNQLLEIIDQNIDAGARATDAVRHFFKKTEE